MLHINCFSIELMYVFINCLIYVFRLISERTVEENILKKANQKRMLGDMAIEGGNFTTAFFKQVLFIVIRIDF